VFQHNNLLCFLCRFAEFVRRGLLQGGLSNEELCTLVAEECGYVRRVQ